MSSNVVVARDDGGGNEEERVVVEGAGREAVRWSSGGVVGGDK